MSQISDRWGGGSSLFGTLSEIFLFFNYDASPKLFLTMLCVVPNPIVPLIKKVCAVSPPSSVPFFPCGVPTPPDTHELNVLLKHLNILCSVPTLVLTSDQMFQIGLVSLEFKHLISLVVSLAKLLSTSVTLPAELV